MKYIETFREGEKINEVYLCKFRQSALTKAGKPYENVILQDKTGTIDAKIWDPSSVGIDEFEAFDYVAVTGDVTSFQGNLQMSIRRVRKVDPSECDPAEYLPITDKDIDEMFAEIMQFIDSVGNKYLNPLLHKFFDNEVFVKEFKFHSAAKSVHHGFVGGLLEHTLSVTKNCDFFAKNYPILNRDLLITAALFHDIGKMKELSTFPENNYTDQGQLIGHIIIGTEWVDHAIREIDGFPKVLETELLHCILSHHGELEFGSPKKPSIAEALALSFADNIDAKMETIREQLITVPEGNTDWLGYNKFLETNVRRTSR
ncbi:MAG: HD domain-containing protein [Clostridiales bacterium]|nr:HD domain-containing protein [Clostridiales bacterium]